MCIRTVLKPIAFNRARADKVCCAWARNGTLMQVKQSRLRGQTCLGTVRIAVWMRLKIPYINCDRKIVKISGLVNMLFYFVSDVLFACALIRKCRLLHTRNVQVSSQGCAASIPLVLIVKSMQQLKVLSYHIQSFQVDCNTHSCTEHTV